MFRIALLLAFSLAGAVQAADKIEVVGLFKNKAVVVIDGRRQVLSAGEPAKDGVRLISADSEKAVLEVNGHKGTYTLGQRIINRFTPPPKGKSVVVAPDAQGMYYVDGSINDFPVKFVVDTGATMIAMNRHQAERIGLNYRMDGRKGFSSTASGLEKVYIVKLAKVTVGDIVLRDVPAAVHDGDYPRMTLLGNSFLNGVDITRKGGLLELEEK
jgi:aspartyl protease family protein